MLPGNYYSMKIKRIAPQGAYLNIRDGDPSEDVLLPKKQVPENAKTGDEINVFVYRDSSDRMISTVNKPAISLGEFAVLEVADTTKIGAFLDWGLEKDLFLPFDEQNRKIHKGDKLFVGIKLDKSQRLVATMKIYDMLEINHPYELNARVKATVISINDRMGAFVAVENKYHGLIPLKEITESLNPGDIVNARVNQIRRDGKLVLSIRKKAYGQMDTDSEKLIEELKKSKGHLPYNDKTDPRIIKGRLGFSKAAFKRAVGRLLKRKIIRFEDDGITLIDKK
jgi:predicted RNA-binding protein (virulence factor B family)